MLHSGIAKMVSSVTTLTSPCADCMPKPIHTPWQRLQDDRQCHNAVFTILHCSCHFCAQSKKTVCSTSNDAWLSSGDFQHGV